MGLNVANIERHYQRGGRKPAHLWPRQPPLTQRVGVPETEEVRRSSLASVSKPPAPGSFDEALTFLRLLAEKKAT